VILSLVVELCGVRACAHASAHGSGPLRCFEVLLDHVLELGEALLGLPLGLVLVERLELGEARVEVAGDDGEAAVVGLAHVERVDVVALVQRLLVLVRLLGQLAVRLRPQDQLLLCQHALLHHALQVPLVPQTRVVLVDVVLPRPTHRVANQALRFILLQRDLSQELQAVAVVTPSPDHEVVLFEGVDRQNLLFLFIPRRLFRLLFLFKVKALFLLNFLTINELTTPSLLVYWRWSGFTLPCT